MQMEKVNRLIDQEVRLGIPTNENVNNILDVVCNTKKLKEFKRELVIKASIKEQN